MPQVDLETLVSACTGGGSTDRKIACESTLDAAADDDEDHHPEPADPPVPHPDSPPESFWLSRDQEFDWWDRNAVYERKESTKGNSNSGNLNPHPNSSNTNSQRFSHNLKSKAAAIIGLPKPQKPTFVDAKNRRNNKTNNARLFPNRSSSVAKSENSLNEPSSPKVSCMGRVRSKRDRNRRLRSSTRSSSDSGNVKPVRTERKPGFFESIHAILCSVRREKPDRKADSSSAAEKRVVDTTSRAARNSTASVNDASVPRVSVSESEPPGLGGMMRFTSGRRSESWGGVGDSEIHVAQ